MKRMLSLLLALALCGALVGCGGQDSSSSSGGPVSSAPGIYMPRMLMVDGVLYEDAGCEDTTEGRCGNMDGEITSSVESWQQPEEDGQSNFGSGFGYQIGMEPDTLEILQDGHWLVFRAVEPES
ncbi:hypothetical protein ACTQ3Z_01205 [Lawsonibacter sp. LCP25S3_F5]